jgi:hypothetical protein
MKFSLYTMSYMLHYYDVLWNTFAFLNKIPFASPIKPSHPHPASTQQPLMY